jgi:hypothetical protein
VQPPEVAAGADGGATAAAGPAAADGTQPQQPVQQQPPQPAAQQMQQQQPPFGQYYANPAGGLEPSNVLLVFIDNVAYAPTLEALHTVFSTYGQVLKMTVFEKSGNHQVRLGM